MAFILIRKKKFNTWKWWCQYTALWIIKDTQGRTKGEMIKSKFCNRTSNPIVLRVFLKSLSETNKLIWMQLRIHSNLYSFFYLSYSFNISIMSLLYQIRKFIIISVMIISFILCRNDTAKKQAWAPDLRGHQKVNF